MAQVLEFGSFELMPRERRLLHDGQPVVLGGRAFDLLVTLIEGRERVVPRDELIERVWPGLDVEPNNLQVQVCTLRRLLGRAAIATVARRGYRFTLDVKVRRRAVPPVPQDTATNGAEGPDAALLADMAQRLATRALLTLQTPHASQHLVQARQLARQLARRLGLVLWEIDPRWLPPSPVAVQAWAESLSRGGGALVLLDHDRAPARSAQMLLRALLNAGPRLNVLVLASRPLGLAQEHLLAWQAPQAASPAPLTAAQGRALQRLRSQPRRAGPQPCEAPLPA